MFQLSNASKKTSPQSLVFSSQSIILSLLSSTLCLIPLAALAHKTEVVGDIAGLWHVEPNHNPRARESARVWVALTRRGGELLPLSQANCQMAVYNRPRIAQDKPILQPPVVAINAEQYRGIPGANVTFPKVGLYQVELQCAPRKTGDFKPFRMNYDVTVAR